MAREMQPLPLRMWQRFLDTVILTVVAVLFSAAVSVLKYRRI